MLENQFTSMAVGPGEGILLYGWHHKPGVAGWQPGLANVLFPGSIHKTAVCHLSLSSSNLRSLHESVLHIGHGVEGQRFLFSYSVHLKNVYFFSFLI